MQTQFKSSMFVTKWSSDIDNFLMLLKLFPFKPIGRNNTAAPLTFKNSIDKLIVYSDVIYKFSFHYLRKKYLILWICMQSSLNIFDIFINYFLFFMCIERGFTRDDKNQWPSVYYCMWPVAKKSYSLLHWCRKTFAQCKHLLSLMILLMPNHF